MAIGTSIPLAPATTGSASRLRSRSSPMSNSRRASSPTTRKNRVISPLLTHSRRSREIPCEPSRTERWVSQNDSYADGVTLAQTSATSAAATRTAALPVSVRRKSRSGVRASSPHVVCPV